MMNLSTLGTIGSCVSPLCSISSGSGADGLGSLTLGNTSTMIGIYQDSGNTPAAIKSRKGLFTAYIDSTNLDYCEMRVYQDFQPSVSYWHNDKTSDQTFFAYIFETGSSTQNLSFEVVSPMNSETTISSVTVYTRPALTTAVLTLVSGLWFLFFGMASFTQFGQRAQTRGDPNVTLTTWQFIKQVNLNLWDSIKFCAKSLKISAFFIGFAGYQTGMSSVVALAGTYLTSQLLMSSTMTGAILMYTQVMGVPGAFIFYAIGNRIGLHLACTISYVLWLVATLLAFFTWTDQTTPAINVWGVMTLFGLAGGGALSLARSTFAGLVPKGREAEFMGLYNFAAKVIAWSGTLLFTAVNESTKSFPKAFLSLGTFFALAIVFQFIAFLAPVPSFLKSVERVTLDDLDTVDKPGSPSIDDVQRKSSRMARNELAD
jgi:hypothetical protein